MNRCYKKYSVGTLLAVAFYLVLLAGCDIKKNKEAANPKGTFITVFENNDFSSSFIPIDVQQTADEGYVILAKRRITESSFYGVYVLKADAFGKFVSGQEVNTDIVNPIHKLIKVGSVNYFFAMDRLTLETKLMRIGENGNASEVATVAGVTYPLHASWDANTGQFLLQHYDRDDLRTYMSLISTAGAVTAQRYFNIGFGDFDVEEPIIDHFTGNGKTLPFFTGTAGAGTYFFNGFYNYTLSTVFFSFNTATPALLQGYRDERCLSSALHLGGNTFAISKYAYGQNTIAARATINTSSGAIAGNTDIPGNLMLEMNPDAPVSLKRVSFGGRNLLAYNTDTKAGQIALYFFEEGSGQLAGTSHFGYANPYKASTFIQTSDEGLAIVGTTYLAGRFPRIVLIKLSKEEILKRIG